MMSEERRTENVINITNTLWQLNKYKLMDYIAQSSGREVPEECYELIEVSFRTGAALMERALGRASNV